jgi:hypothetical protein
MRRRTSAPRTIIIAAAVMQVGTRMLRPQTAKADLVPLLPRIPFARRDFRARWQCGSSEKICDTQLMPSLRPLAVRIRAVAKLPRPRRDRLHSRRRSLSKLLDRDDAPAKHRRSPDHPRGRGGAYRRQDVSVAVREGGLGALLPPIPFARHDFGPGRESGSPQKFAILSSCRGFGHSPSAFARGDAVHGGGALHLLPFLSKTVLNSTQVARIR